ncbi:MAG: hypothetical protein FWB80_09620 [Defluviitaleaceae bacterium]|nr:hypothetical protein [Defluviitaleaceae bacterium]
MKKIIIGCVVFLVIALSIVLIIQNHNIAEAGIIFTPVKKANYTITAVMDGEAFALGAMNLRYSSPYLGTVDIVETRTYTGIFFREDIDTIINEKHYRFLGSNLGEVQEREWVNGELNISHHYAVLSKDNYVKVHTYLSLTREDDMIIHGSAFPDTWPQALYLPNSDVPISIFASNRFYVASRGLDITRNFANYEDGEIFFFYNLRGTFDLFRHIKNETIETIEGYVRVAVVESTGEIDATLWIDSNGLIYKIIERLDPDFSLYIVLESILRE